MIADYEDESDLEVLELRQLHLQLSVDWRRRFTAAIDRRARDLERWSRLCAVEDPERWSFACHEAGHALAFYLGLCRINRVSVIAHGSTRGTTRFTRGPVADLAETAMGLICGPVAENLLGGARFQLGGTDKEKVTALIDELDDRFTFVGGLRRSRIYREVEERARKFVLQHRQPICLLGTLLYEFGVLGASSIDEVFDTQISSEVS
jgi:hypothetical protein